MQAFSAVAHDKMSHPSLPLQTVPFQPLQLRPSIEFVQLVAPVVKEEEEASPKDPSNPESRPLSLGSLSRASRRSSRRGAGGSSSHNFQKHTVVTVKKLTRGLGGSLGPSAGEQVALQMWNIFLASGIKSKRMLVVLFGCAQLQEERYKALLKSCFFGELCSYEQATVRAAQQILRERVAALLTSEAVRENIERNRHIKKRDNFYAYFMEFVEMLRNGPLVKFRINSTASQRILERMQTSASLQPTSRGRKRGRHRSVSRGGVPSV